MNRTAVRSAVLLAAGRGTRMGALTADTPKPLLEIDGRPLLVHILAGLSAAGIKHVVIVTGYLGERIQERLGNGRDLGIEIRYCHQEHIEGTARALLGSEPLIGLEPFMAGWGDILLPEKFYGQMRRAFLERPCDALLAVNETDDPCNGAAVYVDTDWRVTRIVEKPPPGTSATPWNNAGLFVLTHEVFDYARNVRPSTRGEYELPRAFADMIDDRLDIRAHPIQGYWSDVGTPADLERSREVYARRRKSGG